MGFETDIPLDIARAAHAGTSWEPERRGEQVREGYAATLAADYEALARGLAADMRSTLDVEFARYREGYRRRTLALLHTRSRIVSGWITGPSNFPARQMQKRIGVEMRRMGEIEDFRVRAMKAIHRTLHPELAPIMLGDSDADTRLRAKLEQAEKLQARMKAANAAIRKHSKAGTDAQISALVVLGFSESQARKLLMPDFCGRIGFADFHTKNNGAEIRRIKARLGRVEDVRSQPSTESVGEHARVEDVPTDNRVRLFFPGKPSAEVRERLKRCGFRWTPTLGCWQAYRHDHTIALAHEVAGARNAA